MNDKKFEIKADWNELLVKHLKTYLSNLDEQKHDANYGYNQFNAESLIDKANKAEGGAFLVSVNQIGFILREVLYQFYHLDANVDDETKKMMKEMGRFFRG